MQKGILNRLLEDPGYFRAVEAAGTIMRATDLIDDVMEKTGLKLEDLAELLDVSVSNISRMLDGERNMTLETLSDLLIVMGYRVEFSVVPVDEPIWKSADCEEVKEI